MKTGFRGTFVMSWSQTEVEGQRNAPVEALMVGAAWAWQGEAVQVDGPNDILRLDRAEDQVALRRRAARKVRRLVGQVLGGQDIAAPADRDEPLMDARFVVTDGHRGYTATLIPVAPGQPPLLMFVDELPPRGVDLYVVHCALGRFASPQVPRDAGVICFTPGTLISTPEGPRPVQTLRAGDRVLTLDNGPQEIRWIGARRLTGARLHVEPRLRPIRIGAGALGIDRPEQALLVSPEHRMLVRGPVAQALFNTREVLVAARDLVNFGTISVDTQAREVTYIHLLLPSHQVLWANGVECESFHPASASLAALDEFDRLRLLALDPELERDPHRYGTYARRNLTTSEAAILRYEAA